MMFVAQRPHRYLGQTVDTGQCVRFCQIAAPGLPHTSEWRRGIKVRGNEIEAGAVIATFGADGRYENKTNGTSHAAILIAELPEGLRVWDQWVGRPVGERTIRFRGGETDVKPVNDGDQFFVVELEG
jgi:hypothetical protein